MQLAGQRAVRAVRADEAGDGDAAAVGEQLGHLGDAADVLRAVGGREAQVGVEPEADVVAVEAVGGEGDGEQVLLEGGGDGGFARGGEAREPDCEAGLVPEVGALRVGEGGVPGYVAGVAGGVGQWVGVCGGWGGGRYVSIVGVGRGCVRGGRRGGVVVRGWVCIVLSCPGECTF